MYFTEAYVLHWRICTSLKNMYIATHLLVHINHNRFTNRHAQIHHHQYTCHGTPSLVHTHRYTTTSTHAMVHHHKYTLTDTPPLVHMPWYTITSTHSQIHHH